MIWGSNILSKLSLLSTTLILSKYLNLDANKISRYFFIENLDDIQTLHKIIQRLNNIVQQNGKNKKFVLFPPISIAPYLYMRDPNLLFIPYSYLIFIKRINFSNPLDFKLFVNDALLVFSKINKLLKNEYKFIFLFDTELFYEELFSYIPTIIIPRNHFTSYNDIVLSLETGTPTNICYVEDLFKILIPITNNVIGIRDYSDTAIRINCEFHDICNPLICLPNQGSFGRNPLFIHMEQLLNFLNKDLEMRRYIIIEIWSSVSPIKLHHKINQSYYLWSPIPHRQYLEALEKFIISMEIPYVDTCYIISPKNGLSEYGSINNNRIWLSSILYPIMHKIEKFHVHIF